MRLITEKLPQLRNASAKDRVGISGFVGQLLHGQRKQAAEAIRLEHDYEGTLLPAQLHVHSAIRLRDNSDRRRLQTHSLAKEKHVNRISKIEMNDGCGTRRHRM